MFKFFCTIVFFLGVQEIVFANDNEPVARKIDFKTIEEINSGIANQLAFLINYNKKNDRDDKKAKNWYVYVVGDDTFNTNVLSGYLEDQLDLSDLGAENSPLDIEELNNKLNEVNHKLSKDNKPLIYYGVANRKKAIIAPFFPFRGKYKVSSSTTEELKEYYKKAFEDSVEDQSSAASETYETLKEFFKKNGEADQKSSALIRKTLSNAGVSGAIALSRYYFAIIKGKKGDNINKANVSWWSFAHYLKGKEVPKIDADLLKAHQANLASTSGDNNHKRINTWYNYLSGTDLPESQFLKEILKEIINNSKCADLSDTEGERQKNEFITAVNATNPNIDRIVSATRTLCSDVLKDIEYSHIIKAIRIIAKESIDEKGEAVVLYLLHTIQSKDYTRLFSDFKENENSLLRTLLKEMDDRSINPFDKDNYTSLIGSLLYIGNQNQGEYLKKERGYLLQTFLIAQRDFEWDKTPIGKAITKVLSFNIDADDEKFEKFLTDNEYKELLNILQFLTWDVIAHEQQNLRDIGDALGEFFAKRGNQNVYVELLKIAFKNKQVTFFTDPIRRLRIAELVFRMFGYVPQESSEIYAFFTKEEDGQKLKNLKSIIEKTATKDYELYANVFYEGLTKILDAENDINTRIELAKWAINNDSGFDRAHENLVVNIFKNIKNKKDRQTVYNFLTYKGGILGTGEKNYEYFNKISAKGVLSGYDKQINFINYYISLIIDGFGDVNDRISIIKHAIAEGDDWSWFWYSDTEDVISYMFNSLKPGDAEIMVTELKTNNYNLFKEIWNILESKNWWAAIDSDNERLANFAVNLSKLLQLSKEEIGWEKLKYEKHFDAKQNYLTESADKIKTNYLPMCRANFFGFTDSKNRYVLDTEVKLENSKLINIKLEIGGKEIMNKSFDPFEYIFVEFVEDTKINSQASFSKGDIIAVPAFYVAWMGKSIESQQNSVAARVTMDGIVIVASALVIYGSGGTLTPLVMAASAEIFFAGTDVAIAIYKEEMGEALGTDFVNTLEIANMIYGLANLPVALKNLPQSLVKLKTKAGNFINYGRGALIGSGQKIVEITVDTKAFIALLPDILSQLKNNPSVRSQLFKQVSDLESSLRTKLAGLGTGASNKFKEIHRASKEMALQFYMDKAPIIGIMVNKFPNKIKKEIVNKLLVLKFEGKTFCKIDPEGFLQKIDIYSRADNYKPIPSLEEPIPVKIKVKGKVYDDIVVIKDYNGSPIFRPQYKSGITRSADLINELHIRSSNSPPYMSGTDVTDFTIQKGESFYIVEYEGQTNPGGFGSKKPITTIEELRKELAVLEDWKNPTVDAIVVREYKAIESIQTRSGIIGSQKEINGVNTGQNYPGGGHQYEFLENWRVNDHKKFMNKVKETKLINNAGGKLDELFPSIKNHPDFQGFKNLCTNNPKVSVKLAGDEWTEFVASTKSSFGIGRKRNIVKMEFDSKEYLIASGKGYNGQMTGSGKFIPEEFVLDIDKGQRVFAPSISTRHLDTESLGLEYFAKLKNAVKGGKYPKVTGKVKIASDLCPCPSCSAIFQQFSDMFPNVTIDITTTTKLHY
ncbi:deaminase domain-containing protein [Aquimarina sp. W85]|uniref:deaminase domain-containing protein n=1 Tax=Aquimarina rhodophyticola TaxID=3342246 RepID=UPI00366A7CB5